MPLLGKAVLINWSNVIEGQRSTYYAWHDREHMLGRLRLPGFQRGRRLWAEDADRDVLNLYEVENLGVLTGETYSAKAANPSQAYRQAGRIITDAIRALAHVRYSSGMASGGMMLTVRLRATNGGLLEQRLIEELMPDFDNVEGIVGAHLCVADEAASSVVTADRHNRPTAVPEWAILIEGTTRAALQHVRQEHLTDLRLLSLGCVGPFATGYYALQMMMSKQDIAFN